MKDLGIVSIYLSILFIICLFLAITCINNVYDIERIEKEIDQIKINKYDINNDGKVDTKDFVEIKNYIIDNNSYDNKI